MGNIKVYTFLLIVFIAASSLLIIQPVKAQVETVSTSCGIFVDNIVEGQPVIVEVQIYPAPPSGEIFYNLSVWMTSPMQGVWGNGGNGPWGKGPISTDADGKATVTFDISTFSGYWNVGLYFPGQYFANDTIYYQPGNWQRGFTVSPTQTPTPAEISTLGPVQIRSAGDIGTNVQILTPQNQSLLSNPIQLTFCVKAFLLQYSPFGNVGYSLDGGTIYNVSNFINMTRTREEGDDVTVWAEVALPKLSDGSHNVTVYFGWQFSGIGQRYEVMAYSTASFFVVSSTPSTPTPTPNPTQNPAPNSKYAEFSVPLAITFVIIGALVLAFALKKKQQHRVS
jgi:hypothetical protein